MKRFDMRNFEQFVLNQCLLFVKKKKMYAKQKKKNVDCSVSPLLLFSEREKKKEEQFEKKNTSKHFMFEEHTHTRRRKREQQWSLIGIPIETCTHRPLNSDLGNLEFIFFVFSFFFASFRLS